MSSSVFIIGNGFDLNLGLKTSYKDFIASDQFQEKVALLQLFNDLNQKHNINKWIDIESELANYSLKNSGNLNFLTEYKSLCESLLSYISSLSNAETNKNSHAHNLIAKEFILDNSYVINFNYTDTVESILIDLGMDPSETQKYIRHVHGSAINKNIIFGVDDRASIHEDHAFLYKSTSNHYGGKRLDSILNSAEKLFFFGHSLGEPDHMYFNNFFTNLWAGQGGKELHFFHYGEQGLYELHKQLHKLTNHNVSKLKDKSEFITCDTSVEFHSNSTKNPT